MLVNCRIYGTQITQDICIVPPFINGLNFSFLADCVFEVLNLMIIIILVAAIIIMRLINERDEEKGGQ